MASNDHKASWRSRSIICIIQWTFRTRTQVGCKAVGSFACISYSARSIRRVAILAIACIADKSITVHIAGLEMCKLRTGYSEYLWVNGGALHAVIIVVSADWGGWQSLCALRCHFKGAQKYWSEHNSVICLTVICRPWRVIGGVCVVDGGNSCSVLRLMRWAIMGIRSNTAIVVIVSTVEGWIPIPFVTLFTCNSIIC